MSACAPICQSGDSADEDGVGVDDALRRCVATRPDLEVDVSPRRKLMKAKTLGSIGLLAGPRSALPLTVGLPITNVDVDGMRGAAWME